MKKLLKTVTSTLLLLSLLSPALPAIAAENDGMQPLENLHGLQGSWNFGDPITSSGGGDLCR